MDETPDLPAKTQQVEEKPRLPDNLKQFVEHVGKPVTGKQIDNYTRLQELEDCRKFLTMVIEAWEKQQTQDRDLRKKYADWLMYGMGAQILVINVVFVLLGLKVLAFEQWTANTFIMAVFVEISALVLLVVKYLFPHTSDKVLELIDRLKRERTQ